MKAAAAASGCGKGGRALDERLVGAARRRRCRGTGEDPPQGDQHAPGCGAAHVLHHHKGWREGKQGTEVVRDRLTQQCVRSLFHPSPRRPHWCRQAPCVSAFRNFSEQFSRAPWLHFGRRLCLWSCIYAAVHILCDAVFLVQALWTAVPKSVSTSACRPVGLSSPQVYCTSWQNPTSCRYCRLTGQLQFFVSSAMLCCSATRRSMMDIDIPFAASMLAACHNDNNITNLI